LSFFDSYTDLGGGGTYLSADEKQFLIDNGVVFEIKGLVEDEANKYGPRWVAFCDLPDEDTGELVEGKIGFPIGSGVDSRDAMLKAMSDYLESEDAEPVFVKLDKPGQAILIVAADVPSPPEKKKAASKGTKKQ